MREGITSYDDPGSYQHPPGTVASLASAEDLHRDEIRVPAPGKANRFACPMHPEVVSPTPADCPKCGMKLTPRPQATKPLSGHKP